ncbi:MAG: 2-oxo acid dehydrogenase subunit E2, partial [Syntrophothermus sp.]
MIKEFTLPELGENIHSADVLQVLIKPGDTVSVDQTVMEIETDKATIEVPSTFSGQVKEVKVKAGDKAEIGQVIFTAEDSQTAPEQSAPVKEQAASEVKAQEPPKQQPAQAKAEAEIKPKKESKTGGLVDIKLPELGENIAKADILQVKVSEGDKLDKDQIILEIETDKATIEVPSEVSGVVRKVFVKAGEKASVGQVIISVEQEGSTVETSAEKEVIAKMESAEKEEKVVQPQEVNAPAVKPAASETVQAPKPKLYIEDKNKPEPEKISPDKIAPAAPTVRRFAREIGININEVAGSGPGGRISIPDVKAYARELSQRQKQMQASSPQAGTIIPAESLPDFGKWGEYERKDMSNIRRKTAEHLSYAWSTIPHVTQFDKADITELENLRKNYGKRAEAEGGKLTVTAVLLKVVASALKAFPQFNSSVDMQNSQVIYKKYYNIGVAVDTDRGLLVPVIKDVDKKNIIELSIELNKMAEKARNKKLSLEEMQGGSFTITNLGGIGGTYFS